MADNQNGAGALAGVRIIDFTHVFQGPVCTQLLADFGADVIKVERPGAGDWSRAWGPYVKDVSLPFAGLNRNKRSLALNMKDERGLEVVQKLVADADVLVHNFRPGAMERLGLGYEHARALNPQLIYASSSGWGDEGPYVERGRGGHDMMARASAGLFDGVDEEGLPAPAGISVDYVAGLLLGQGILMALVARNRTGEGQRVTTDLLSGAFHCSTWGGTAQLNHDRIDSHGNIGAAEQALRRTYRTADGFIELSPTFSETGLSDLSQAMELGDLCDDPRFSTNADVLDNREALNEIVGARFVEQTTEAWILQLEPKGILCARIMSLAEAAEDPQVQANDMVIDVDHPRAGKLRLQGTPIRMSATPSSIRQLPPDLGGDGADILAELGYSETEIEALQREGVV
ncbi:MAG: CaiB/BaiF CoA-transferase family protein [Candidatus Latescibacteria bacterium]|jgi:crotonobetainyl-CoA:carnitine CoA-transferase CaiB-like acyl-CoA transferase|nr:CaiB/BaiF CoA-transferase family protein [Candidatus Latescibacterota bacterium]MDP7447220.1 CaiB/BaiF CoA-transferase family protein [Candidatus Latescibacterota bacterium]HJP30907.1 CaiB/BaiF CoA-transferase family protein [Candidatus Latescibacterota bacterium]